MELFIHTPVGSDPLADVPFTTRPANHGGRRLPVLVPAFWGPTACDTLSDKYLRKAGVPDATEEVPVEGVPRWLWRRVPAPGSKFGRETSFRQAAGRIAGAWAYHGWLAGYFRDEADAWSAYSSWLRLMALQAMAPASPQWFNTGVWWAYGIEGADAGQWAFVESAGREIRAFRSEKCYVHPAVHACFLQSLDDSLVGPGGISDLLVRESTVYKYGGGSGTNFGALRGFGEPLSGGGYSSGLLSFLRPFDSSAGAIQSGGTVRRAAKMTRVDLDHPDVEEFIDLKVGEEQKVAALVAGSRVLERHSRALMDAWWEVADQGGDPERASPWLRARRRAAEDGVPATWVARVAGMAREGLREADVRELTTDFQGEAYKTVTGQNSNNSVGVPNAFFDCVDKGLPWPLVARTELAKAKGEGRAPRPLREVDARALWDKVVFAAWSCADPGVQFDTTVNEWHTCPKDGKIHTSNPCLAAGTLIDTDRGRIPVEELARLHQEGQALPQAYAWDGDRACARQILRAWKTGHTRDLVQVGTSRGLLLTCTPSHKFLLASGEWCEARNLLPGTALRTLLTQEDQVAKVQPWTPDQGVDVYDLEVQGVRNYGATNSSDVFLPSICVHNCSEYFFLDDTACFAGGTRISTPGGLRTVADLYAEQEAGGRVEVTTDIYSEGDHRRVTAHRQATVTLVGERDVVRVSTNDGRSITVTPDHKFLTDDGKWLRVDQMSVGTRICVRESGNPVRFASPQTAVDRWRLLGWIVGDGVFSKGVVAICFGGDKKAVAERVLRHFNEMIEEANHYYRSSAPVRGPCHLSEQNSGVLQASSSNDSAVRYLEEEYGMTQATAVHKDVPAAVHKVSDDLKVAFLQGLFSADGCFLNPDCGTEPVFMLASSSPELLRSVQLILGDLGIVSSVHWLHPTGRANPQGQLKIYNQQGRKFARLIGFPLRPSLNVKANLLVEKPFGGQLKNPRPAKVVSIEPAGREVVYDVTEPVTHSLIAEGFIAHNCNLASLNLVRFYDHEAGEFDVVSFERAARLALVALDISVTMAGYPSEAVALGSGNYRTTGLGYANLGALVMRMGLPYDGREARAVASAITCLMHCAAASESALLAKKLGAFPRYEANKDDVLRVVRNHAACALDGMPFEGLSVLPRRLDVGATPPALLKAARGAAHQMLSDVLAHGLRNAQLTLLAPSGTIGLLMDCDTTGVEPDFALVKWKTLVGGGQIKLVNESVPHALRRLGYAEGEVVEITRRVRGSGTLEGCPHLSEEALPLGTDEELEEFRERVKTCMDVRNALPGWESLGLTAAQWGEVNDHVCGTMTAEGSGVLDEHLAVFDCANRCGRSGTRSIRVDGHLEMMAAVQPFLSGAISKTVNLPPDATLADVNRAYRRAHELMLKACAVYRDGCKHSQPLRAASDDFAEVPEEAELRPAGRRKLPDRRAGITQKYRIGNHKLYLRTGEYEDGTVGEIFIDVHKEGASFRSVLDCFAIAVSLGLQYGVPLEEFVDAFTFTKFEPNGPVQGHATIRMSSSVMDMVFRDLAITYLGRHDLANAPGAVHRPRSKALATTAARSPDKALLNGHAAEDDPFPPAVEARIKGYEGDPCPNCHHLTVRRKGTCLSCDTCGFNTGCG